MTSSLNKIVSILAFFILSEASAMNNEACRAYLAKVETLRQTKGSAKDQIDLQFSSLTDKDIKFDKSWFYLDLGDVVLPVPEQPKKVTKQKDGTISISSGNFTAVAGGDVLKESVSQFGSLLSKRKIHSDYDFNLFLFGQDFTKCDDIQTNEDSETKTRLAMIKALEGPFEIKEVVHAKNAETISLAGPHRAFKKLVSNVIIKRDSKTSHNILLYFSTPEQQAKYHSYLSKIRDKDIFKTGTALTAK